MREIVMRDVPFVIGAQRHQAALCVHGAAEGVPVCARQFGGGRPEIPFARGERKRPRLRVLDAEVRPVLGRDVNTRKACFREHAA